MTEQQYINVRDLSNVIGGFRSIASITIANQPNIDLSEYRAVMGLLDKWQSNMFSVTKIDE